MTQSRGVVEGEHSVCGHWCVYVQRLSVVVVGRLRVSCGVYVLGAGGFDDGMPRVDTGERTCGMFYYFGGRHACPVVIVVRVLCADVEPCLRSTARDRPCTRSVSLCGVASVRGNCVCTVCDCVVCADCIRSVFKCAAMAWAVSVL